MANNEVKTTFVIDDKAANAKLDAYEKRLKDVNRAERGTGTGGSGDFVLNNAIIEQQKKIQTLKDGIAARSVAAAAATKAEAGAISGLGVAAAGAGVALATAAGAVIAVAGAAIYLKGKFEELDIPAYEKATTALDEAWKSYQRTLLTPLANEVAGDINRVTQYLKDQETQVDKTAEKWANLYRGISETVRSQQTPDATTGTSRLQRFNLGVRAATAVATLGTSEHIYREMARVIDYFVATGAAARKDEATGALEFTGKLPPSDSNSPSARLAEQFRRSGQYQGVLDQINREREQRQRGAEEAARKAADFQERLDSARVGFRHFQREALGAISTNPLVKFFGDASTAAENAAERFKILGARVADQAARLAARSSLTGALRQLEGQLRPGFAGQFEAALSASNLGSDARRFQQRSSAPDFTSYYDSNGILRFQFNRPTEAQEEAQRNLDRQIRVINRERAPIGAAGKVLEEFQRARDQQIISLTSGFSPDDLTYNQSQMAADARFNESRALERDRQTTVKDISELSTAVKEIAAALNAGTINTVTIQNEAPDKAFVQQKASPAATQTRYNQR